MNEKRGANHTTIRSNVFFGFSQGLTVKGNEHSVEHNTGEMLDVCTKWAAGRNFNSHSSVRYNAVRKMTSRGGSTLPGCSRLLSL